jgi:hypothetical protein
MRHWRLITSILILMVLVLITTGCKRGRSAPPQVQQTTGLQPAAQTVTVTGCLRTGAFAEDTWVLITPVGTAGAPDGATFQLMGGDAATLRDNAGRQVQISGTVDAEQQVASSGGTMPEHRAKGTSGTPAVETQTEIEIKRLRVSAITPTNKPCVKEK